MQINTILLAFSAVVLYTSWINRSVIKERDPFLAAIVFLVVLLELILLMEMTAVKGNAQSLINAYFYATAIVVVIVDVTAVMGIKLGSGERRQYLVGTKFQLAYLHFFLATLYMIRHSFCNLGQKKNGIGMTLLLGLTFAMSIFTDCTTGIVGAVLFVLALQINGRYSSACYNPFVYGSVLMASFALSFVMNILLLWEPIQYVIVQVLDKDITLTSRTKIFVIVPMLLRNRYLLGYGYGTTYELGRRLGGFPNTQNALWEWIWQCGILGTVLLFGLMLSIVDYATKSHKLSHDRTSKYMLVLVYLFSVLASIEITIDISYLGYLAMLIPLTHSRQSAKMHY